MVLSIAKPDSIAGSLAVMLILAALVGANYGANLAIFPSITKDYYGLKKLWRELRIGVHGVGMRWIHARPSRE